MGETEIYIRSGLGESTIHKSKPLHIPFFQSLNSINSDTLININGSIELGLLSKDGFFLNTECTLELQNAFEKETVLKAFNQGENRLNILKNYCLETIRKFSKEHKYNDIVRKLEYFEAELLSNLKNEGIYQLKILKFTIERTPLDDYDLNNIIHFEKAKEIVTQIARVKIKDKSFIDKCRKTISHFDIVDE